jgi:hypothetical protein
MIHLNAMCYKDDNLLAKGATLLFCVCTKAAWAKCGKLSIRPLWFETPFSKIESCSLFLLLLGDILDLFSNNRVIVPFSSLNIPFPLLDAPTSTTFFQDFVPRCSAHQKQNSHGEESSDNDYPIRLADVRFHHQCKDKGGQPTEDLCAIDEEAG